MVHTLRCRRRICNRLQFVGEHFEDLTVSGDNQCRMEEARTFDESFLGKHDACIYALLHVGYISVTHGCLF